ncbi:PhoP regulatory network YrbL family protein [Aliarcobacter butzleri]|uniref:PhoP regulatory network YrbL family protein n=1 Tax=Aliarcobacter butzleri TaxID=28197 RepID=UPI001EE007BC|nr:PhoP regulatory network YrbL family protein [Aliarcobacter butzleri]MCG3681803.1 PhoP regulatory network YrbL family protein [Aliarcobacter butzleri]
MIILKDEDFVGKGNERACYIHPEDKNKAIKITYENNNRKESKQTKLEVNYYKELEKRRMTNFKHLPKYFGEVKTDKGAGFVVELIRDFDGEVSKTFEYYLKKDGVLKYKKELEEYKQYFLDNCIIFNYGMMPKNILLRKNTETDFNLVLIDGLGDVSYFTLPNKIPYFARKRINRRWDKFIKKYL